MFYIKFKTDFNDKKKSGTTGINYLQLKDKKKTINESTITFDNFSYFTQSS